MEHERRARVAALAQSAAAEAELERRAAELERSGTLLASALRREAAAVAAAAAREAAEEERQRQWPLVEEVRVPATARALAPFGFPSTAHLKCHSGYVAAYDRRCRTAAWSCERIAEDTLRRAEDAAGAVARGRSQFQEDPTVPARHRARLEDYRGSGFDRGHLTPAADIKFSQEAMDETFLLSNVSPQVGKGFNRDYWARLEQFTRGLVHQEGGSGREVFCCSGPLYLPERDAGDGKWYVRYRMIPDDEPHVAVPTHFYKAVAVRSPEGGPVAVAAFVLPNRPLPGDVPLESFAVSLEQLEEMSGLQFFQELPEEARVPLATVTHLQLPPPDWWKRKEDGKAELTVAEVASQLDDFVATADMVELSFAASLSPKERALIHKAAEERGLKHESTGHGSARHVVVSKKRFDAK